jgi:ABC-type transport system involved in cytochrome bd biosynthesis fused ATPase/permease subunit
VNQLGTKRFRSGKLSLVALLFLQLEAQHRSMSINVIGLQRIPHNLFEKRLTIIFQEPTFLKDKIKQNLDNSSLDSMVQPSNELFIRLVYRR